MATTSNVTSAYAALHNSMRISGMASGMDTETMVANLMKVERLKYDAIAQKKQKLEWTNDANLTVNNLLKDFRDTYFSTLGTTNLLSAGVVNARKVTMSATDSGVTITAGQSAVLGTHNISVTTLASGANASAVIGGTNLTTSTALNALPLSTPLTFEDGVLSFAINGQTFSFNETDTLQTVLNRVNSNAAANVTMSYNSLTGELSVKSKKTGADSSLVIENLKGNAFAAPADGIGPAAFGIAQGTYSNGTNAQLSIDGVATQQSSNTFTINGLTYNLSHTTSGTVGFSVESDIDASVNAIKNFVTGYNNLIAKLNSTISEEYDSDYPPLTDDQKAAMSESDIEKWEAKAKTGLLQNNSYISGLLQSMRSAFYETVSAAGLSPSAIGLNTGAYYTKGQITVDETRLRQALTDNPDAVAAVFTATSTATTQSTVRAESGLAARLRDAVNGYLNDYTNYRKTSSDDQMRTYDDDLATMQEHLDKKEERYWNQFTAMETALAKLNSQSSWLSSALGGVSAS